MRGVRNFSNWENHEKDVNTIEQRSDMLLGQYKFNSLYFMN